MDHDAFVQKVEAFLREHDIAPTRFGIEAAHDSAFVIRARAGRNFGREVVKRVNEYMEKYNKVSV